MVSTPRGTRKISSNLKWESKITTMKNRGATPRCFNRVLEGKKDA